MGDDEVLSPYEGSAELSVSAVRVKSRVLASV